MSDEVDQELTRLFAVANEELPPDRFVGETLRRLERSRRFRTVGLLSVVTVVVAAAAVAAPFVASVSVDVVRNGLTGVESFAEVIASPAGLAASVVVAFFVLVRVRAPRR